jgi:hypothetical protein
MVPKTVLNQPYTAALLSGFKPTPTGTILVPDFDALPALAEASQKREKVLFPQVPLQSSNMRHVVEFAEKCRDEALAITEAGRHRKTPAGEGTADEFLPEFLSMAMRQERGLLSDHPLPATAGYYFILENGSDYVWFEGQGEEELHFQWNPDGRILIKTGWFGARKALQQIMSIGSDGAKTERYYFHAERGSDAFEGIRAFLKCPKRTSLGEVALMIANEIYWARQIREEDWGDSIKWPLSEKVSGRRDVKIASAGKVVDADAIPEHYRFHVPLLRIFTEDRKRIVVDIRCPDDQTVAPLRQPLPKLLWDPLWNSFVS